MRCLAAFLFCAFGACSALAADPFPSKPLRLIVPYAAGGGTDTLARVVGQKMGETLGQPVVIDNRPAAGGIVAMEIASKSAPDGYTIIMGNVGPTAVNPSLYAKLPYNPIRDFAPITLLGSARLVFVVPAASPLKTLGELVAMAKEKPGVLTYASSGNGSSNHLAGGLFNMMAGVDMTHVPYKGAAPAITDLIAGRVDLFISTMPSAVAQIKAGSVRAIAVTSLKRAPSLPNVPTADESGLPGYEAAAWYGLLAPAGTPSDVVARLNKEAVAALRSSDVGAKMAQEGADSVGGTPEAFAAYIKSETEKWARVVKASGMTPN
jgi:tripartite-type tricarboxylate transporter receptor subunit TctC